MKFIKKKKIHSDLIYFKLNIAHHKKNIKRNYCFTIPNLLHVSQLSSKWPYSQSVESNWWNFNFWSDHHTFIAISCAEQTSPRSTLRFRATDTSRFSKVGQRSKIKFMYNTHYTCRQPCGYVNAVEWGQGQGVTCSCIVVAQLLTRCCCCCCCSVVSSDHLSRPAHSAAHPTACAPRQPREHHLRRKTLGHQFE